jgi:hypothetical protein
MGKMKQARLIKAAKEKEFCDCREQGFKAMMWCYTKENILFCIPCQAPVEPSKPNPEEGD